MKLRFTSWARLEPSASDPDLTPGLVAAVADPAWFLARQWQFGEFRGDDASTPATVQVTAEIGVPNRVRLGDNATSIPFDPLLTPLDVLAEREPAPPGVPALLAAEVSLMLIDELGSGGAADAIVQALRTSFPLPALSAADLAWLAPASRELMPLIAPIAFDGVAVVRAAAANIPSAAAGASLDVAVAAVRSFVDARLPAQSAWVPERLGSTIEVGYPASGGQVTARSDASAGEQLGWWSFDRSTSALGAGQTVSVVVSLPLPAASLGIAGAPANRYWEMEDAAIDFGAVGVAPSELARLVVLEYLFVYGNDMVVVPLELPYGCRCVITGVELVDTFGDRVQVPSAGTASGGRFKMWTMTGDDDALAIPPLAVSMANGPALEEVMIARDEQSNVAWLIESLGSDPAGTPLDIRSMQVVPPPPAPTAPDPSGTATPPWRWKLTGEVPAAWHPLLPVGVANGQTRLMVGTVAGSPAAMPRSRLLAEMPATGLPTAAIPAEGIRIRRRAEATRWIDGSRHLWIARDRRPGTGDVGSGMVFDTLEGPVS